VDLKIAIAQMNSQDDWEQNAADVLDFISLAAAKRAKLILFPENVFYMGPSEKARSISMMLRETVLPKVFEAAADRHIAVLIGGHPEPATGRKVFNTSVFIDETGTEIARYRKLHLFDVKTPTGECYRESDHFKGGNRSVVLEWRGIRIGLSICFDLRFPEHYRSLVERGAEWIFVPSAFTAETGKAHWHTLLRARAIENQATVIAPAQTGRHPQGRKTFGHSLVVGPWGKILKDAGTRSGLYFARVPLQTESPIRSRFPLTH
jgi:deaminated glutathione amidase